jgi:hypothetical protein
MTTNENRLRLAGFTETAYSIWERDEFMVRHVGPGRWHAVCEVYVGNHVAPHSAMWALAELLDDRRHAARSEERASHLHRLRDRAMELSDLLHKVDA